VGITKHDRKDNEETLSIQIIKEIEPHFWSQQSMMKYILFTRTTI